MTNLTQSSGKFTAPLDGIYYFHAAGRANGSSYLFLTLYENDKQRVWSYRGKDTGVLEKLNLVAQLKLKQGDIIWIGFNGNGWTNLDNSEISYFEGRLVFPI